MHGWNLVFHPFNEETPPRVGQPLGDPPESWIVSLALNDGRTRPIRGQDTARNSTFGCLSRTLRI
jgi:hypothetical protein